MDNTKQWIRCSGLTGCNHKEGVCTASPEYQAQFAKPVPTMDNTNAVLAKAKAIVKQFYPEMPDSYEGRRVQIAIAAIRQPTQTDALREATGMMYETLTYVSEASECELSRNAAKETIAKVDALEVKHG